VHYRKRRRRRINKNSGAHKKNFNEDRFILSAAKAYTLNVGDSK